MHLKINNLKEAKVDELKSSRGTQRQFSEKYLFEDDLRSRIFGTFVVKFFDPYNFRITRLSARKSEHMKNF